MRRHRPTAAGTQRRLQALMARSWSMQAIAQETGLRAPQLARALENPATITPKLATDVIAAYDRLWGKTPPSATPAQQELARAAETAARLRGWAPPLAWDDDKIDNPRAEPVEGWQRRPRAQHRSADLAEDARFLDGMSGSRSLSTRDIAQRLGTTTPALQRALTRQRACVVGSESQSGDLSRESKPSGLLAREGLPRQREREADPG